MGEMDVKIGKMDRNPIGLSERIACEDRNDYVEAGITKRRSGANGGGIVHGYASGEQTPPDNFCITLPIIKKRSEFSGTVS